MAFDKFAKPFKFFVIALILPEINGMDVEYQELRSVPERIIVQQQAFVRAKKTLFPLA
jgi:hypothetical protein